MTDLTPRQRKAMDRLDAAVREAAVAFEELDEDYLITEWIVPCAAVAIDPTAEQQETMVLLMQNGTMAGWKAMGLLHGGLNRVEGYVFVEGDD